MAAVGVLITVSTGVLLVAYLLHCNIHVPPGMDQPNDIYWLLVESIVVRGLGIIGEYIGFGHRVELIRSLYKHSLLSFNDPFNTTGVQVRAASFDGVKVFVHDPDKKIENGGALMWIHGGGWVFGGAAYELMLTEEFSRRLSMVVVSVEYRLAPEHVYPSAFDDCFTAAKYFVDHAVEFGVDPTRIAIGGLSAGATLAAAVSLKFRDTNQPTPLKIQALLAPCLQPFDFNTPSYQSYHENAFLPAYFMIDFWLWYAFGPLGHSGRQDYLDNLHTSPDAKQSEFAGYVSPDLLEPKYIPPSYTPTDKNSGKETTWEHAKDIFLDPYFAPLMARDLGGLPETYIAVAGWDILRDDGLLFGKRLEEAGVPVTLVHYPDAFHHLLIRFNHFNFAQQTIQDFVEFLSAHL